MKWINPYGLFFMAVILIPNMVFAVKCPQGFENAWENKTVERLEQIGRFGCFGFMIVHIPGTWFGFPSDEAFAIYLMANVALIACYCLVWIICFRKSSRFRALALSILPSLVFLLSGILSRSPLLILSALLFAPCHILLSYKNAVLTEKRK
ncbi:MAG: hypothetical protein ACI4PH_04310 [Faecousia sp.]